MRCKPFTVVLREVVDTGINSLLHVLLLYSCNYTAMCVMQKECIERFKELTMCTIVKNRKDA